MTGVDRIRRTIPHRYPMLLVDRVTTIVPGERITAVKAVSGNEPWYRDLPDDAPPEAYEYPPALLIESWCQAACLLAAWEDPTTDVRSGRVALFGGISDLTFHGRVFPGDVLEHTARIARAFDDTWIFEGSTSVAGRAVLEVGSVMTALRSAELLVRAGGS